MNSTFASLFWKEWCEHRWKLVALLGVFVILPVLAAAPKPGVYYFNIMPVLLGFGAPLMGLMFGLNAAAGERSSGTLRFLESLPVESSMPAKIKLLVSILTVTTPLLCAMLAAATWHRVFGLDRYWDLAWETWRPWGCGDSVWGLEVAAALSGVSVLIWSAAIGVNWDDEIRAGAGALLVMASIWAAIAWLSSTWINNTFDGGVIRLLIAVAPGGAGFVEAHVPTDFSWTLQSWGERYWPYLFAVTVVHGALACRYIKRHGKIASSRRFAEGSSLSAASIRPALMGPPRRTAASAIVWKQLRVSAPLAGLGAGLILLFTLVGSAFQDAPRALDRNSEKLAVAFGAWMMTSMFVAVVAGIGVFMEDLKPAVHSFWRSRPVAINQWFVLKYVTGLLVTVLSMAAIPAIAWTAFVIGLEDNEANSALLRAMRGPEGPVFAAGACLLAQTAFYAAAATGMIWLRHPLFAALTGLAAPIVILGIADWLLRDKLGLYSLNPLTIVALVLLAEAVALASGWLALRNDWGWKR